MLVDCCWIFLDVAGCWLLLGVAVVGGGTGKFSVSFCRITATCEFTQNT